MATAKKNGGGAGRARSVLGVKVPREPKNVRFKPAATYERAYSPENMQSALNRVRVYNRYVGETERIARKGGFMVSVNLVRRQRPKQVSEETFLYNSAGGKRSVRARLALSRTLGGRSWQNRATEFLRRFNKALGKDQKYKNKVKKLFQKYGLTARQLLQMYDLGLIPDKMWYMSKNYADKDANDFLQELEKNIIKYKQAVKADRSKQI